MLLIYSRIERNWILYSKKSFGKLKIWKFNENWRAVCISVFHFPCKAESIRKKSRIVEASSYVFMQIRVYLWKIVLVDILVELPQ